MSTRQGNKFLLKTKGGRILNFSFTQSGGRENIRKHKYQVNATEHGDVVPGKNGVVHNNIKCYVCQTLGHYSDQCPGQTWMTFSNIGIILSQG